MGTNRIIYYIAYNYCDAYSETAVLSLLLGIVILPMCCPQYS